MTENRPFWSTGPFWAGAFTFSSVTSLFPEEDDLQSTITAMYEKHPVWNQRRICKYKADGKHTRWLPRHYLRSIHWFLVEVGSIRAGRHWSIERAITLHHTTRLFTTSSTLTVIFVSVHVKIYQIDLGVPHKSAALLSNMTAELRNTSKWDNTCTILSWTRHSTENVYIVECKF